MLQNISKTPQKDNFKRLCLPRMSEATIIIPDQEQYQQMTFSLPNTGARDLRLTLAPGTPDTSARYARYWPPVRPTLAPGAPDTGARYARHWRPVRPILAPGTPDTGSRYARYWRPISPMLEARRANTDEC